MVLGSDATFCPERSRPALSWACMWPQVHGECQLPGRELWEVLFPASPTYALLLWGPHSGRAAQPPAPSLQLPISWASHSRPCSLATFQQAVQLPGIHGPGLGRRRL